MTPDTIRKLLRQPDSDHPLRHIKSKIPEGSWAILSSLNVIGQLLVCRNGLDVMLNIATHYD